MKKRGSRAPKILKKIKVFMNSITNVISRIGTYGSMVFFTILIVGFSFAGGVVPSAAQAYFEDSCWDCGSGSYTDSIDWSYDPYYPSYTDSIDWSYDPDYPSYTDSIDWSYDPYYPSYTDSIDWSYDPYYPSYTDAIDWSYDPYYPSYDTPYYQDDYGYGGCGGSCGGTTYIPPLYVDGNCYSGCGGSHTPPPPRMPPPPTGCGYSFGGCGGSRISTPSYFNSSNTNINTNTNINNTNISNVNTNTNSYFNVQSQNPFIPQPVCTVYASPNSVQYGGGTTLTWNTSNATSAYLSGYGTVSLNGSQWISNVTGAQTYTITVNGQGGSNTCSATVTVYSNPVPVTPTCTLTYAQAGGYNYGYGTTYTNSGTLLSWSSTNASSAYITNIGTVSPNGSQTVYPTGNMTYNMTVYGVNGGANSCSVTLPYTPPVQNNLYCTMTANPASIQNGAGSVLSWTSYGATSATLSDGLGNAVLNGSLTVRPESSRVYTLTVRDYQGRTNTCYATVTVSGSQISLTSIPYTGFDGGITTNALYWMGLALWALIAGWFVVRYRGLVANVFDGGMRPAYTGLEPTIIRERIIEKSRPVIAETPVPASAQVPVRKDTSTDTMALHSKEGETPRLVIKRG